MALSIKHEEADRLARELARETNQTLAAAIIDALREALLRAKGRRAAPNVEEAVLRISDRCAALPDIDTRSPNEILGYDEHGGFD